MKYTLPASLALLSQPLLAQSTIDPARAFSYGANVGWISWKPNLPAPSGGAVISERFLSGKIYSANCGWLDLGDGSPVNFLAYQNTSAADFGVNVGLDGALTGYAYGANIGYIQFEQVQGRPKINLLTGAFSGYAYGANVGWIHLGDGQLGTLSFQCTDTDGDGIGDEYERQYFSGSLTAATSTSDADKDGVSDKQEYAALTDPKNAASFLRVTTIATSPLNGFFRVTFTTQPGRTYSMERSADLRTWTVVPGLENFLPDAGATTSKDIPAAGSTPGQRYFRARARKPLAND